MPQLTLYLPLVNLGRPLKNGQTSTETALNRVLTIRENALIGLLAGVTVVQLPHLPHLSRVTGKV